MARNAQYSEQPTYAGDAAYLAQCARRGWEPDEADYAEYMHGRGLDTFGQARWYYFNHPRLG